MISRLALLLSRASALAPAQSPTKVGMQGWQFTMKVHPTDTAATGFPNADPKLVGTLFNLGAVRAIFDPANYPRCGTRAQPYESNTMGAVSFEYPNGAWDPERNTREFIEALPSWRRCGLLAFTVNLQGDGPTDGNYGENGPTQPRNHSGFDAEGGLKPAYSKRLERVIAPADAWAWS